jgi:hypothetical protein
VNQNFKSTFFRGKMLCLIRKKQGWATYILGHFVKNSSGHPGVRPHFLQGSTKWQKSFFIPFGTARCKSSDLQMKVEDFQNLHFSSFALQINESSVLRREKSQGVKGVFTQSDRYLVNYVSSLTIRQKLGLILFYVCRAVRHRPSVGYCKWPLTCGKNCIWIHIHKNCL